MSYLAFYFHRACTFLLLCFILFNFPQCFTILNTQNLRQLHTWWKLPSRDGSERTAINVFYRRSINKEHKDVDGTHTALPMMWIDFYQWQNAKNIPKYTTISIMHVTTHTHTHKWKHLNAFVHSLSITLVHGSCIHIRYSCTQTM